MKPVPKARQTSSPGARLVSGRLLNQICEAIQARTPLNAGQSTAKGHTGAAAKGGTAPPRAQTQPRFQASRVYVVPPATVAKWAEDLRARMPADGVTRASPMNATAAGLDALLRAVVDATPDAYTASAPEGYRLPVTMERTARLTLEYETKVVHADLCSLGLHLEDETYITKKTTVSVYENGSQTYNETGGGNIRTWTDDTSPTACDLSVFDNDFDPEFDYGAFLSSTYTEITESFSSVRDAAVTALTGASAATPTPVVLSWLESAWKAATAPGGWSYGLAYYIGTRMETDIPGQVFASTFRWRAKNTGQGPIKLFWERRLESDDSVLATGSISIGQGTASAWQSPPATPADPTDRMYVTLSAIQLGPYR